MYRGIEKEVICKWHLHNQSHSHSEPTVILRSVHNNLYMQSCKAHTLKHTFKNFTHTLIYSAWSHGLTCSEGLQQMVQSESAIEWEEIGTGISGIQWRYQGARRLHIKLVSRIIRDKEDPLTSGAAPAPNTPVPEADGWMWMQFTHEQGRKEKTIFPPLLCSCYPLMRHFSMMCCYSL